MQQLQNKTALITGAGSGIGKALALGFAKAGATIIVTDLHLTAAEQTANEIIATGGKALALAMDVSNEAQVDAGVAVGLNTFKYIDILISNAGLQHIAPIHELSLDMWQKMLEVHLTGAFLTTRACLKAMYQADRGGSIIYIGSAHSKEASKWKAPYVTAKHGLLGLCRTVAKEAAAYNVRANVICPGFVRTPLVDKQIPEQAKQFGISEEEVIKKVMLGNTVDGEFTTTEELVETALFIASMSSNAITGQSLLVSHGWVME
jgi:3-hydroxybutyrate dehydrogenase